MGLGLKEGKKKDKTSNVHLLLFSFPASQILHANACVSRRRMPAPRQTRLRSNKFDANITRKGLVNKDKSNSASSRPTMGPAVLAFLLFVVVGSTFFGIIQQMSNKL